MSYVIAQTCFHNSHEAFTADGASVAWVQLAAGLRDLANGLASDSARLVSLEQTQRSLAAQLDALRSEVRQRP